MSSLIKLSTPLITAFLMLFASEKASAQDFETRVLQMKRNDSKLLKTNPLIVIDQKKLNEGIQSFGQRLIKELRCPTIGITVQQAPRDWRNLEDMIRDAGNRH